MASRCANTEGGTIYISVDDDGRVIGVHNQDDVLLKTCNAIRDAIYPDITLFAECKAEEIDKKTVIEVWVQSGTARTAFAPI